MRLLRMSPVRASMFLAMALSASTAACTAVPAGTPATSSSSSRPGGPERVSADPPPSGLQPPSLEAEAPEASGPPAAVAQPVARHADPDLEAVLPDSVDGNTFVKFSVTPDEFLAPESEASFSALLAAVGGSRDEVTMAVAQDPSATFPASVTAFRVRGAAPDALKAALLAAEETQPEAPTVTAELVNGRHVTSAAYAVADVTFYRLFYAVGDTVFVISSTETEAALAILETLP